MSVRALGDSDLLAPQVRLVTSYHLEWKAVRMKALTETVRSPEAVQLRVGHPLDAFVANPAGMRPVCDEMQFRAILEEIVADEAPRLFAVVQEYGDRVDSRIAAWGMAFADRVEVVSVDGGVRMRLSEAESVLQGFNVGNFIRARLVWFNPDAAASAMEVPE